MCVFSPHNLSFKTYFLIIPLGMIRSVEQKTPREQSIP